MGFVEGDGVPLCDGVGVGAGFAGVVGAGGEEGVGVEAGGPVGDWEDYFDVGDCEGDEEGEEVGVHGFGGSVLNRTG